MDILYRVAWKWKTGKNTVVQDYAAPDLKTLMKMLKRSENVAPETVGELVIHQINNDGTVTEMFATCDVPWSKDGTPETRVPPAEEVVTAQLEKISKAILDGRKGTPTAAKPRIRLTHATTVEPEKHYAANGLYYAIAAT
jgi:hypothetical protein